MPARHEAFAAYAKPKTMQQNEQRFLRKQPVAAVGDVSSKALHEQTMQAIQQVQPSMVSGRSYVDMIHNQRAINSNLYTTAALESRLPPQYQPVPEGRLQHTTVSAGPSAQADLYFGASQAAQMGTLNPQPTAPPTDLLGHSLGQSQVPASRVVGQPTGTALQQRRFADINDAAATLLGNIYKDQKQQALNERHFTAQGQHLLTQPLG